MNNIQPHELGLIPPPLTEEEEFSLEASLLKNGQIEDITLYEGKILNGNHKYRILIKHGIKPRLKEFIPNGVATPEDFVLAQLEGRHLTVGQRACVAAIISERTKKDPLENLKHGPNRAKRMEGSAKNPDKNRTISKVAKSIGVGSNSTMKAKVLLTNNKPIFDKVYNGKISIESGYQEHRRMNGSIKIKMRKTKVNLDAFKVEIKIPNCTCYESELKDFIKTMNSHGWILEMRFQDGKVYAHWFGNGYLSMGNNWSSLTPEFELKRAIIVAANDKKDKL